jgi:hypothetical protein
VRAFERRPKCSRELGVAGFAPVMVLSPARHRRPDILTLRQYRTVRPAHLFKVLRPLTVSRGRFLVRLLRAQLQGHQGPDTAEGKILSLAAFHTGIDKEKATR